MRRALAIETSGRLGSVAAVEDGLVVGEAEFPHGLRHAAELVPMLDAMLRQRGWTPRELNALYVSAGPGSFTGLRIGITLVKTLAFVTGAVVAAVPTVEVLARNAPPEARHVVIVLNAKRDQIFTARLRRTGADNDWTVEESARLDTLSAALQRAPRPVYLLGEGMPEHEKFIPQGDGGVIVTAPHLWRARAAEVAHLGEKFAARGEVVSPQELTPLYIRRPEAEEKLELKG